MLTAANPSSLPPSLFAKVAAVDRAEARELAALVASLNTELAQQRATIAARDAEVIALREEQLKQRDAGVERAIERRARHVDGAHSSRSPTGSPNGNAKAGEGDSAAGGGAAPAAAVPLPREWSSSGEGVAQSHFEAAHVHVTRQGSVFITSPPPAQRAVPSEER